VIPRQPTGPITTQKRAAKQQRGAARLPLHLALPCIPLSLTDYLRVDFFAPRTNLAHMKPVIAGGGSRLLGNNLFLIAFVEP